MCFTTDVGLAMCLYVSPHFSCSCFVLLRQKSDQSFEIHNVSVKVYTIISASLVNES